MTYEELRIEFDNPVFRKRVKSAYLNKCANCGSIETIEYHHIVPLFLGGTNNISNIIPLCHKCHAAAHRGRHVSKYASSFNAGRKSTCKIDKDAKIFDMFIRGEIGNKKCTDLLGYSKRSPVKDRPEFKRYLKQKGISKVRNLVDVAFTTRKDGVKDGDIVGEVVYEDGTIVKMKYMDTGANDIDYRRRA